MSKNGWTPSLNSILPILLAFGEMRPSSFPGLPKWVFKIFYKKHVVLQKIIAFTLQNSANEIFPSLSASASVIVRSAILSSCQFKNFKGKLVKFVNLIRSDIRTDHHIEDKFELISGDITILIQIVHRESNLIYCILYIILCPCHISGFQKFTNGHRWSLTWVEDELQNLPH